MFTTVSSTMHFASKFMTQHLLASIASATEAEVLWGSSPCPGRLPLASRLFKMYLWAYSTSSWPVKTCHSPSLTTTRKQS